MLKSSLFRAMFLAFTLLFSAFVSPDSFAGARAYVTHHESFIKSEETVHRLVAHAAELGIDTIYAVALRTGCSYFSSPTLEALSGEERCAAYPYVGQLVKRASLQNIRVVPWLEWSLIVPSDSVLINGENPLPTLGAEKIHHGVPTRHLDFRSPMVLDYIANLIIDSYRVLGTNEVHLDDNFAPLKGSRVAPRELTTFLRQVRERVRKVVPDFKISFSSHTYRHALENYSVDWASWLREGLVSEVSVQMFHKRPDLNGSHWRSEFLETARKQRSLGATTAGIYAGTKDGWRAEDLRLQHQILDDLGMGSITFTLTALLKKYGGLGANSSARDVLKEIYGENARKVPYFCQYMQVWNGKVNVPAYAEADSSDDSIVRPIPSQTPVYRELTELWQYSEPRVRLRYEQTIETESSGGFFDFGPRETEAETEVVTAWVDAKYLRARSNLSPEEQTAEGCTEPSFAYNTNPFDTRMFSRISSIQRAEKIPVLMYHDIVASEDEIIANDDVAIATFEEQLDWLKSEGFETLSLRSYYQHIVSNRPVPEKSVLITFDDGYIGNYTLAYPALKQRNMHATFFVHTAFVGVVTAKDHVDYDEWREVIADPLFDVQSHTVKHLRLSDLSEEDLERELVDSKNRLELELMQPIYAIAYPYGDHNAEIEVRTSEHYRLGFSVGGRPSVDRNVYNIKRIGIGRSLETIDDFVRRFEQR